MAPPTQTARGSPNLPTSVAPASAGRSTYRAADPVRVESLQACVEAARRSTASFLSLAPAEIPGLPMALLTEMTHAVQALFRLSQLEGADWDRRTVRSAVDVVAVLDSIAVKLGAVAHDAGFRNDGPGGGDLFTDGAASLRATIPIWRAALEQASAAGPDSARQAAPVAEVGTLLEADEGPGEMLPAMMGADAGDSMWFTDMFSFWDN